MYALIMYCSCIMIKVESRWEAHGMYKRVNGKTVRKQTNFRVHTCCLHSNLNQDQSSKCLKNVQLNNSLQTSNQLYFDDVYTDDDVCPITLKKWDQMDEGDRFVHHYYSKESRCFRQFYNLSAWILKQKQFAQNHQEDGDNMPK